MNFCSKIEIEVEHHKFISCFINQVKLTTENMIVMKATLKYVDETYRKECKTTELFVSAPTFEVALQKLRDSAEEFLHNLCLSLY